MSKPNKAGELRNVKVDAISLVPKAANKERFKIFKGAVADEISGKDRGRKLNEAFEALQKVLGVSRYFDDDTVPETDSVKITAAIEDFRNIALEIFLGNTNAIEKAGRKISNSRLTKLKDIQTLINDVMSGLDDDKDGETDGDLAQDPDHVDTGGDTPSTPDTPTDPLDNTELTTSEDVQELLDELFPH